MKNLLILAALGGTIFFFATDKLPNSSALAFGEPEHSSVAVTVTNSAEGAYAFSLKIGLKDGIALNMEAPWKLIIKSHEGLVLDKIESTTKDFDSGLPGFRLQSAGKPSLTKGKVDFTLVAFICTKDKTRCYREVHNGSFDWGSQI